MLYPPGAWLKELEGCQHTLIGDEVLGMKGISGGQRRRVSGEPPALAALLPQLILKHRACTATA